MVFFCVCFSPPSLLLILLLPTLQELHCVTFHSLFPKSLRSILFSLCLFFLMLFLSLFRLDDFYSSAFKFTDYVLCCLYFALLIQRTFCTWHCIFQFFNSICSFCSFRVSLLFIISHCYFIVIVTTAFMALSDNSDIGSFHLLLSVFSLENGLHFSGASY